MNISPKWVTFWESLVDSGGKPDIYGSNFLNYDEKTENFVLFFC